MAKTAWEIFKKFYGNCPDSNPSLPSIVRSQNYIMSHKSKEYIDSSDEEENKYVCNLFIAAILWFFFFLS